MTATGPKPATVTALLAERASSAPALIYGGSVMSYDELEAQSRRAARGLRDLGIGPGDRIALWLPNTPAWLVLYFACARLGAIAVAVNTRYRSAEVADIVGRSGCKLLALWPAFKGIDFAGILADVDPASIDAVRTVVSYDEDGAAVPTLLLGRRVVRYRDLVAAAPEPTDRAKPESGCNVFTTSGTTKAPKLVLHRQSVIVEHARDVARHYGLVLADTVSLQAVPLCGVFGFCQAMAALAGGATLVLMPLFDGGEAARLIDRHRVTQMICTDDMVDRLLIGTGGDPPLPTVRYIGYARFNPALADIAERAMGRGVLLRGLYGMSEVQALFSLQPADADPAQRALGGGVPVSPRAEVRVRDPDSGRLMAEGEDGAIEIRAPSLMVGYMNDDESTRQAFTDDGFFRTGDLGHLTADGGFVFLTRMGDVLRLGGFLVNPVEIETYLLGHPAVDGCQVVGVTARRKLRAVAFVVAAAATDEDELIDFCRKGLANYKVPERIIAVDSFPTTMSANGIKIQRGKLREMAIARLGGT